MLILIGGGARSGKSSAALDFGNDALNSGKRALFIATAEAVDQEMTDRISKHKADRDPRFLLIEESRDLCSALGSHLDHEIAIIDCLTLWLSNQMFADKNYDFESIIKVARSRSGDTVFVTNETGEGIVPMHPVSREFRDLSGNMNQYFARACDEVYFMRFGLMQKVK
jgi:adenosylcobinamide kinase/adenosylcobinamide-phosphate guanylyltransferase